jgi:S1-C subfamily serine protease
MIVHSIDHVRDLALLVSVTKETTDGPYSKIARHSPNIGDKVYTIGSPLGDTGTVTDGIISNFQNKAEQRARDYRLMIKYRRFRHTKQFKKLFMNSKKYVSTHYRTTTPAFYGNSGGGLFNTDSELVGVIDTIQLFRRNPVPGAAFAVSLETIREFL